MTEQKLIEDVMQADPRRVRLVIEGILSHEQRRALVRAITPEKDYAAGVLHAFRAQVQHLGLRNETPLIAAVDAAMNECKKD